MSGESATVDILESGTTVFFRTSEVTFSAKLVDAKFPPYAQIIPTETKETIRVRRQPLLDTVKAVSIAADKSAGIKFTFAKSKLRVESASVAGGDGEDELSVEYGGAKLVAGFNAKYLVDALGALTCDEVDLGFVGELDPMTIKPVGSDGFLGIVMPMRT